MLVLAAPVKAQAPILPILSSVEEMKGYATERAKEAGVSPVTVLAVISCESQWIPTAVGDYGHSIGLAQINLPSHTSVSREMAEDPRYAINFLVNNLKDGNGNMWTCYRMLKSKTPR